MRALSAGLLQLSLLQLGLLGCGSLGGTSPPTHYYQLMPEEMPAPAQSPTLNIAVERFRTDSPYDDERIVYRPSPHRLSYYYYHRWSSRPGSQVADFLRDAYARSGYFLHVGSNRTPETDLLISGRIRALEEVDARKDEWMGRVTLDIDVRWADTGTLMLSRSFEQVVPMDQQNPEGLARALSAALTRIASSTAPLIARAGEESANGLSRSQRKCPPTAGTHP